MICVHALWQAVIRHQDVFVKGGNITTVGQILQLATILGRLSHGTMSMAYISTYFRQRRPVRILHF